MAAAGSGVKAAAALKQLDADGDGKVTAGELIAGLSKPPTIGFISGSCRTGSYNTMLAKAAGRACAKLGSTLVEIDLGSEELKLELYNEDLEKDGAFPEAATKLKALIHQCDGLFVTSPEYNGFVSPLLLNALTWCSRGNPPNTDYYQTFRERAKACIVAGASLGPLGGSRAILVNRSLLQNVGINVLPQTVAVGSAYKAFNPESGDLADPKLQGGLEAACAELVFYARCNANRGATDAMSAHKGGAAFMCEYGHINVSSSTAAGEPNKEDSAEAPAATAAAASAEPAAAAEAAKAE